MLSDLSWMDEGITDPDKPLYEATAKLYCRLCDVHKINDWEAHIFTNKHSHNKYRYKTFYRICCGLLSGFLIGVGAFLIIAI